MLSEQIRFKFYKKGEFKYLSHLDISRMIIRALNRTGFRLAYSQGYNPKPKISFSAPTPLGIESLAEYADVFLYSSIEENKFKGKINSELKPQIQITEVKKILVKSKSLMNEIGISLYIFTLDTCSSNKGLLEKFYRAVGDSLIRRSDFSRSIFDLKIIHTSEASDIIMLKLFGYAKIFNERENEYFKFNNFYSFLKSWLEEYRIRVKDVIKEELFIISDGKLKTPMEII